MGVLYNLGILLYSVLARILAPFNLKARLWTAGRKNWLEALNQKIKPGDRYIWIHCASLGEFEQGRPIIEAVKNEMPHFKIIVTFFSPSGYEIRKNYQKADIVCYLPADTPKNAEKFISVIKPVLAVFVKYEFWYNYISVLKRKGIPLFLVSAIFRKEQHFFRWYGSFSRNMLQMFGRIFVQDLNSLELLQGIGYKDAVQAGDTRFDRVVEIAGAAKTIPQLENFRGNERLLLAGSSWTRDEEIISEYINKNPDRMKWVFAPHEIGAENIRRIEALIRVKCIRFSELTKESYDARVLIIDNIGMLSSAYRYAYIAAIGGGFGKGIHNILEPACWSIPVLFGPNHLNFREAVDLINLGGAKTFKTGDEFMSILDVWLSDENLYRKAAETAGKYVRENTGATYKIMADIRLMDMNNPG
jgi:3-deoxy-D-manno-octulosonic-acid transferase